MDERGKNIAVDILLMSMQGNIANAITRKTMGENRIPTEAEFSFLSKFSTRTSREISEFLYEHGFSASIALIVHDTPKDTQ